MTLPDQPVTVTGLLSRAVTLSGDAPAIHYGDQTITFRALESASRRAAAGLAALGVGPADRVAFWLPNTPAYLVLYFACARLGAISVAINTRFRAAEVEDVLGRTGSKVLIMWPGFRRIDFPGLVESVDPAALERAEYAVLYGEAGEAARAVPGIPRSVAYDSLFDHGTHDADAAQASLGCNTFTTSGTSRAPKFVLHAHASVAHHAADVARDFGHHAPHTVVLQDLPLTGVFGFAGALAALAAGRPTVLTHAFDAERSIDMLRRHRVTHFDASDEMVDRLLRASGGEEHFAHVEFVGFAAFNSSLDDIVERAEHQGLCLVGLWGMSEMQALVARRDRDDPPLLRKRGGGRLVSARAEVRVRHPETGELCTEGVPGELEIRGPSMMREYLDDAEATAHTLTSDGFVRTGDLAALEPGGAFHYLTRMGDVLRLGGYLVNPAEIEAEVLSHPAVSGAQVVAAPVAGADRAVSFVIPAAGAAVDAAEIQAHCARRLAKYKVPARVLTVSAFPVTDSPNGMKVQRAKLRQMALEALRDDGDTVA